MADALEQLLSEFAAVNISKPSDSLKEKAQEFIGILSRPPSRFMSTLMANMTSGADPNHGLSAEDVGHLTYAVQLLSIVHLKRQVEELQEQLIAARVDAGNVDLG